MGTPQIPSVDSDSKQFPDQVRTRIAGNIGDSTTPEGKSAANVAAASQAIEPAYRAIAKWTQPSYSYASSALTNILGLSKDGTRLYLSNGGFSASQIGVSTDGGATVAWGSSFGGGNGFVQGIVELLSGEIEVSVQYRDNTPGQVFRSTGWSPSAATASTWTAVLTASGTAGQFDGRWGFTQQSVAPSWSRGAGERYYVEYGSHTNESSTPSTAAVRAWRVTDTSVTEIFNLANQYSPIASSAALHCHGIAYDPYADQVVITTGDSGATNGQSDIWVKNREDLDDGTLWTSLVHATNATVQCTAVVAIPTGLILLSDSSSGGVRFIARHGYRKWGQLRTTYSVAGTGPIGGRIFTQPEQSGAVCFLTFQAAAGGANPTVLATSNGRDIYPVYTEGSAVTGSASGIRVAVGPDASGRVYAYRNMGDSSSVLVAASWNIQLPSDSTTSGGGSVVANSDSAARYGLIGHAYPAHVASSSTTALTSGTVYVARVMAEADAASGTRTTRIYQVAAASGLTLAKTAIYDATGNQLGVSQDQSTAINTSGPTTRSIPTGSFALTKGTEYWVAFLVIGTTGPTLTRTSNTGNANAGVSGANLLWATAGTGASDLPASITPANLSSQNMAIWFGLL